MTSKFAGRNVAVTCYRQTLPKYKIVVARQYPVRNCEHKIHGSGQNVIDFATSGHVLFYS